MGKRDPRVDAYIAKAPDFAKPILTQVRDAFHAACPDVEEDMKWSFPHFMYKGMLGSMAAFRAHAAFGFWQGSLVLGAGANDADAMGQFGRLTKAADLPSRKQLQEYVKKAAALNDRGVKVARKPVGPPKPLKVPADLMAALKKSRKALDTFDGFPPSQKREYADWITDAKSEDTRARRLDQAIEWMAQGKVRNWKYLKT